MSETGIGTGIAGLDRLIGGLHPGDNLVWEADAGAPLGRFVRSFLAADGPAGDLAYVSFNRSPQTVAGDCAELVGRGSFTLVDCFTTGKGAGDERFMRFHGSPSDDRDLSTVLVDEPADVVGLQRLLAELGAARGAGTRYVFDSLTGMLDLWGDEDAVLRCFGHLCPLFQDLGAVAYWLIDRDAHSPGCLAKVRHLAQVVVELAVRKGVRLLTVRKALGRRSADFGLPQRFELTEKGVAFSAQTREDRELALLTRLGAALGRALEPHAFFAQTMAALADEFGMLRGSLVLLDRSAGRLRIAAAHGLTEAERVRGEYAVGEGVTGQVVASGRPEVVPDVAADPRFLDRTAARRSVEGTPIAFICVPLAIEDDVVGALSVDRAFADPLTLEKDLRLLTIVAATVSQVLAINRLIRVEKEEILARDERRLADLKARFRLDRVVGHSREIEGVLATAAQAARSRAAVLITGETGTGKELIAKVVHFNSDRAGGPLVALNCGALPDGLLESELFGHVKGAFTGAVADREGRFALADGGTLFLDEIGEMSPRLQVRLLRVLQEMKFEPVGSAGTRSVDVRVVAATSRDLRAGLAEGWFREDLFYRLEVIPIRIPPLRERRSDIPLLVDHFLEIYNERNRRRVTKLTPEVLDLLVAHDWPGNVRELENCIERAVVMAPAETVTRDLLPASIAAGQRAETAQAPAMLADLDGAVAAAAERNGEDWGQVLARLTGRVEAAVLQRALATGKSQRELAERLGMSRTTLRKRLREHGLG